jgi:hypothetical protein
MSRIKVKYSFIYFLRIVKKEIIIVIEIISQKLKILEAIHQTGHESSI